MGGNGERYGKRDRERLNEKRDLYGGGKLVVRNVEENKRKNRVSTTQRILMVAPLDRVAESTVQRLSLIHI